MIPIRLTRLLHDVEAILLAELAPGLRLHVLILLVVAAFLLGLFTASWRPDWEAERLAALEQEVLVIRNQQRHLWREAEATRTKLDRDGLTPVAGGSHD